MRKHSLTAVLAAVPLFLSVTTGAAMADTVSNDLDAVVDATAETMPLNVGGPDGTTTLTIGATNNDGKNGCNFQKSTEALTVSVSSSKPSVATVSPSSVTFNNCGDAQTLTVHPLSQGSTTVSLTQVSNTTGATFDLAPAVFNVNVTAPAPANTAPTLSVSGPTGGGSYAKGSVPPATCQVVDKEDGPSSFPATLSWVSGAYTADGIGQQKASCSYTDKGGLTASASVTYSIVDPTAPEVAYTLTPSTPNGTNGWYTGDVSLTWKVSETDSPSSLGTTGCADASITSDQPSTDYSCQATSAGGTTTSGPVAIQRDATPPAVVYDGVTAGHEGNNGWYTTPVTVGFTATDALSGPHTQSQTVQSTTDGANVILESPAFTDEAGNTTAAGAVPSAPLKIDTQAPKAPDFTLSPEPNTAGWNNGPVTVSFSSTGDNGPSGVVSCTPAVTISADTPSQTVEGTCTDAAGNVSPTRSVTVEVDSHGPQVVSSEVVGGTPGTAGWYTSDVTVRFTADDDLSGPSSQTADVTSSGEGVAVEVASPPFTDDAGNTTGAGQLTPTFKIDKSAPNAPTGTANPAPNGNGWNNTPVTVSFTGNGDNGPSGPGSCTGPITVSEEGAGQDVRGTCVDLAGNTSDATSATVNLDMTPPAVSYDGVDGTSGANGWFTSAVTVRFSATDALSGVAGDKTKTVTVGEGDGVIVDSPVFSDLAGNQATPGTAHSDPLKIDTLAPNAPTYQLSPAPNAAGWNHEAVIVHFVPVGDNGPSGVARCTDDIVVNTEGADQTFTGTCTDNAGNVSAKTTATVNLDETGPTNIQFAGAVQDGGSYYYGAVPAQPTCSATDTVSGVTGCVVSGDKDPGAVGSHTYIATATNGAGLSDTGVLHYTVVGWTAKGFYAPVNMGGVWNTVKNGSTVPLKFEVFTDHELTDTSVVSGFTQQPVTCPGGSAVTDPVEQLSTTGGTSLRYDTTAGQFVQNWQTPKKPGACFTVTATLRDGSAISAGFMLK